MFFADKAIVIDNFYAENQFQETTFDTRTLHGLDYLRSKVIRTKNVHRINKIIELEESNIESLRNE